MHLKPYTALILFYFLGTILIKVRCGSLKDVKDLHTDLLKDYDKHARPVKDQDDTVKVYLSFAAVAIQEFNEILERFSVTSALFVNWRDEDMSWDPAEYGNITSTFLGYKDIWVPELILNNPAQKLDSFGKEWQKIRYYSSGTALWLPGDLVRSTCSLNVLYFPFDIQECSIELNAWGYMSSEVKLIPVSDNIDTTLLSEHGTWNVIKTTARAADVNSASKVTFTFVLERKSQYVIVNIVLPILFLCLLNVLVFVLPAESGERVSYAITVLLAIAVFMTIVSDTLPKTSEPIPLISYFLMIDLIVSAVISLFTILNLRIFHKHLNEPIPKWLTFIHRILTRRNRRQIKDMTCKNNGKIDAVTLSENRCSLSLCEQKMVFDTDKGVKSEERTIPGLCKNNSANEELSWKDISIMLDCIFFVLSIVLIAVTFIIFLIITKVQ